MQLSLFDTKVTMLRSVCAKSGEPMPLAFALMTDKYKGNVMAIRNELDEAKQKEMKKALPCYTASGLFGSPVDNSHLIKHSGYICIDLDEKDNLDVKDFHQLKTMIHEIPYVAYCGLSVRGNGFFCIIPIKDPAKHSLYFKALQRDFMSCGLIIDPSCCDISRKRFVSYDPDPYINTGAEVYDFIIPEQERITKRVDRMTDVETRKVVEDLLHSLAQDKTDITADRQVWFEVLCGIASQFGEGGREYAHEVSQYYDGYSDEETDNKYDDVLKHKGYGYTIASLFYHANKVLNSAVYEFKDILVYGQD